MKTWADFKIHVNGTLDGHTRTTCPQCSAMRKKSAVKCLSVNVAEGVWLCHHCGWAGTLKDGQTHQSDPTEAAPKVYRVPEYTPVDPNDRLLAWFSGRGITAEVVKRNQITVQEVYMPQVEGYVRAVAFPYYRNGKVVNVKYRDNNKNFVQEKNAEKVFYGLDDVKGAKDIIIVEGELDKLSLEVAGFKAVLSVPDGAPAVTAKLYESKFSFMDSGFEAIQAAERVILAVDGDSPGQKLEEELARRIGKDKCLRVRWPSGCKDANDVLLSSGAGELRRLIQAATPYPIEGLYFVSDIYDDLKRVYKEGYKAGISPGWSNVKELFTLRPGEWTVTTGIPSHGKSELWDAIMINTAQDHAWRWAVYSPENYPLERHLAKLIEKYAMKPFLAGPTERINEQELLQAADWADKHFYFLMPPDEDSPKLEKILELARAAIYRYGVRGVIIDPWNEMDHSRPQHQTETEYISQCLTTIRNFARRNDVHVVVIAHPTKLQKDKQGEYPVPTPYDISGSAHWRNKADNALAVYRPDLENVAGETQVHVQKIRFKEVGRPGVVSLYYDRITGCYSEVQSWRDQIKGVPAVADEKPF